MARRIKQRASSSAATKATTNPAGQRPQSGDMLLWPDPTYLRRPGRLQHARFSQKVECDERDHEPTALGPERGEVAPPVVPQHDRLAVDQCRIGRRAANGFNDACESIREVGTASGPDLMRSPCLRTTMIKAACLISWPALPGGRSTSAGSQGGMNPTGRRRRQGAGGTRHDSPPGGTRCRPLRRARGELRQWPPPDRRDRSD
jgi:hypothetical protein